MHVLKFMPPGGRMSAVMLCAGLLALGAPSVGSAISASHPLPGRGFTDNAVAARTVSLVANASLKVTKNQGSIINAQGLVAGTISGSLTLHTTVNSASRMTSSFVGSSRAGTLEGTSVSDYGVSGNTIYYTGIASITHGTGVYAHVHATGIHVEGTMDRRQKIVKMKISGSMSL
jgi:hypothetical protein